jgi:HD-GYP domain-containing protein (c-di-GMP phosphodiesterase class II)
MSQHSSVEYYKPVATECLLVDNFPPIALYLRRGNGNYILYKTDGVALTAKDQDRLKRSNAQFVYVRAGDAEVVARYLEEQVRVIVNSDDVAPATKEWILSVAAFNYLNEVFTFPEHIGDLARCKKLLKALISQIVTKESLMRTLAQVLDGNYQLFSHSIDVTVLAMLAHQAILDIHGDELLEVGVGTMFHDVGIILLTSESLEKPYPCSDVDYSRIKLHPQMGYNMLLPLWGSEYAVALDIVRYHHEKFDGSGYPRSMTGAQIPRSAQIVSICDVYSSLTTDRQFRRASSPQHTLEIMESESAIFNKEYLRRFKAMILQSSST